jgi:hypothetical protein
MLDCLILHSLNGENDNNTNAAETEEANSDFFLLFYPNPHNTDVFSEEICGGLIWG